MKQNKRKIINDPVFGFITVPSDFLYDLIQHPYFQRLNRIKQLGLSSFVYPGTQHTRFQHSIGALYLMTEAVSQLRAKGIDISVEEADAVYAAILLHDIGHGPFSHVLESSIAKDIAHEEISLLLMQEMNKQFGGKLDLALEIFNDHYSRRFFHQMVAGQLDMDRLDYLTRDSFFSGVAEGTIGSARIIKMLNVKEDRLVVEAKGIYSIENFLVARRLMYWQVYLHKTAVAAEKMLEKILLRAKELAIKGVELFATPAFRYFLYNKVDKQHFVEHDDALQYFVQLDDSDIICFLKAWMSHPDKVLSKLSTHFINRQLFKVNIRTEAPSIDEIEQIKQKYMRCLDISSSEAAYFFADEEVLTDTYSPEDDTIDILYKDGTVKDISFASDMLNLAVLSKRGCKHYFCYFNLCD